MKSPHANNLRSVYKSDHSTEKNISYIQNEILSAQDRGKLTLLDLFVAFDTIDHDILLSRMTSGLTSIVWC